MYHEHRADNITIEDLDESFSCQKIDSFLKAISIINKRTENGGVTPKIGMTFSWRIKVDSFPDPTAEGYDSRKPLHLTGDEPIVPVETVMYMGIMRHVADGISADQEKITGPMSGIRIEDAHEYRLRADGKWILQGTKTKNGIQAEAFQVLIPERMFDVRGLYLVP